MLQMVLQKKIHEKDIVFIDFTTGMIKDKIQEKMYQAKPFSEAQKEIYLRGGLLGR